ncbi:MAG: hypothetical protein IT381_26755 [Deltaproteobacteria bacterium]|nr:hypothetical protein [Deltaproteobacteria bacterium]
MSDPNATVAEREDLHRDLAILRIAPDTPRAFMPGQHLQVGIFGSDGSRVSHYYSLASAPASPLLEVFVALADEEHRASCPAAGTRVFVGDRANGDLDLLRTPPKSLVVMLATGTGISPFMSMLRANIAGDRRIVLIHAVRDERDLGYKKELEARRSDRFVYEPIVSRDPGWRGRKGRVQQALDDFPSIAGAPLTPNGTHVFVCGNRAMVDEVTASLMTRGFAEQNLHFERYW